MKDFSNWNIYEGSSEGSGRSEKVWLEEPETGIIGLFKFKKDKYTTDHVSECIAYDIAKLIHIPCAKFELGVYNGREGSFSYNITQNKGQILIEGINFISAEYPQYDAEQFMDLYSGEHYSIEMIKKVMGKYSNFTHFLFIPIFDYLIGNSDRHQSNWAILFDGNKNDFSPLYDNSSSLCAYITDEQIESYLGNDIKRWNALVDSKSRSLIRRTVDEIKRPTHLEVLIYLRDNYYDETYELVKCIIETMNEIKIDEILLKYSDEVLQPKKKLVIKKFLLDKVRIMKQVYM